MNNAFLTRINDARKILITTHKSPDGDAIGSSVACAHFLKAQNKEVLILLPDLPAKNLMSRNFLNSFPQTLKKTLKCKRKSNFSA